MEDERTKVEVKEQIENIKKNNLDNLGDISSLEMLLNSNNNGKTKDENASKKFLELKKKLDEVNRIADEFVSMLE